MILIENKNYAMSEASEVDVPIHPTLPSNTIQLLKNIFDELALDPAHLERAKHCSWE